MRRSPNEVLPEDIDSAFLHLRGRANSFSEMFGEMDPKQRVGWRIQGTMQAMWTMMARPARTIGHWILETRAIPKGKAKAVELAVRAFGVKKPRDTLAWWHKNQRHVQTLLEARDWPERREKDGDELIFVGPFSVHNTVHLTGEKLRRTVDVVDRATSAVQASDPIFGRVLYGPIYIVGRLKVPKILAWYYDKEDVIYLRPMPKDARDETFNLIHELGHRYWNKFASRKDKQAWFEHDAALRRLPVSVPTPKVGDLIPINGKDEPVPIREITYLARYATPQAILEGGGRVPVSSIVRVREINELRKAFPSPYATTNAEEHFCEAFAMHVLGILPPAHEAFFEQWVAQSAERAQNPLKRRLLAAY